MKRISVILLALVLVFASCGGGKKATSTAQSGKAGPTPWQNADGSVNLDRVAYYDPNYDYTKNEKFKVYYAVVSTSPLNEDFNVSFAHWAPLFNCDYGGIISANGDSDQYLIIIQNLIDQGAKGFWVDPDVMIIPAVADLMDSNPGVAWMSVMAPPRDGNRGEGVPLGGDLLHPYIGFDNFDNGLQAVKKLIEWKNKNIPNVAWKDIGFVCMDFSVSPPLHERTFAPREEMLKVGLPEENYFLVDAAAYNLSIDGSQQACAPVISTHSNLKYWLVNGLMDDLAQGAAQVLDSLGLSKNSCVVSIGGSSLQKQFDAGQQDAFRYAFFCAQNIYAEPLFGTVYAYMNGWATPDTIFPRWVHKRDHGTAGHSYARVLMPSEWIEFDTYKKYLEWTDIYAKSNVYNYPQDGLTRDSYSALVDEVPPEWNN